MPGADARRLDYIDGLRLVGAVAVVVQHLFERFDEGWAKLLVAPAPGVFGVVLFFMISGFVIPFSIRGKLNVLSFAIRRVTRIYPVYLLALGLAFLFSLANIAPYFRTIVDAGPGEWIANLLLVQDFTPARPFYSVSWTLTIELIWYASFIILVKAGGKRAGPISAFAAPALMVMMTLASLALGMRIPLGRPGMVYAAVLGYQTYRYHEGKISLGAWRFNLLAFLAVTIASNSVAFGYFHHPRISLMQALGPWTAALVLFVLVISIPALRGRLGLANPAVARLGATSYSIYMMHPLAIALALPFGAAILVIPAAFLLIFGIAFLSYHFVELPGIRLGRSLAARRPPRPKGAPVLA